MLHFFIKLEAVFKNIVKIMYFFKKFKIKKYYFNINTLNYNIRTKKNHTCQILAFKT